MLCDLFFRKQLFKMVVKNSKHFAVLPGYCIVFVRGGLNQKRYLKTEIPL